jgi:hypothetical protein
VGLLALSPRPKLMTSPRFQAAARASINGSFSCQETDGVSMLEAGGHVFSFTPTATSEPLRYV